MDILGEFWRTPSIRDKLEFCHIEGNACLRKIFARCLKPQITSGDIKKCMNLKTYIAPLGDFCELFKSQLVMLYMQSDRCVWVSGNGMEMDPEPSRGGDKGRMNDGS